MERWARMKYRPGVPLGKDGNARPLCIEPFNFHPYINNKNTLKGCSYYLERVMGIEPTSQAWEAGILPMNYTRMVMGL